MKLKTTLFGEVYHFHSVKEVLAKANEEKSGDIFINVAAKTAKERIAAKRVLAAMTLDDLRKNPTVEDEVTELIDSMVNETVFSKIKNLTVSELRECILSHKTSGEDIAKLSRSLTGEMVAAVAKIMTNMDLVYAASKIRKVTCCNTTIGQKGTMAFRAQPNHPIDDLDGILVSMAEGLSYASGDACIGVNPNNDGAENTKRILDCLYSFICRWEVPTQIVVLSHITTQMEAVRMGAPCSMLFQSIAGTEMANTAFGINKELIQEGWDIIKKYGIASGPNLMYFETGQGSEMSLGCDMGVDEMTLEARTYGFCKAFDPFMVNNVSGFIGPETIYDSKQMIRANLEDHFMGKLSGLPMGMAPCYTNHTNMDQNDQETATMLLAMAGSNYYMGVPVGDDIMLSYQDTSYHDDVTLRELLSLTPAPEFFKWTQKMGILNADGSMTDRAGDASIFLGKQ